METLTIAEAAERTGLTHKAVRNRVDRGHLRAVLRDGTRRIPLSELERAGLLGSTGEAANGAAKRHEPHEAASAEAIRALIETIREQERELVQLKALTREAESLRQESAGERQAREAAQAELFEARARITELEATLAERRRWLPFKRSRAA
jgi:excisionase family DNA binding protein